MKRLMGILIAIALTAGLSGCACAETAGAVAEKPRVIVTTDGECDDYDSLHHMLLYANELDIAGIVYSASAFHFQGDGEHTLGEIIPDYLCKAENAAELTEYRPQDMGWIERTVGEEYAADYVYLSRNDPEYPTPEALLSVVKVGNVAFEGDVREDTEGSDLIRACILDDDPRTLYIESWGGFNTVARALLSIYEAYGETDEWPEIYAKVTGKVLLQAHAQDKTYKLYIKDLYPDLVTIDGCQHAIGYFAADRIYEPIRAYFNSEWLAENIKFDHGALMSAYYLIGDGSYYEGEIDQYQFGLRTRIGFAADNEFDFDRYDWLGEGDSPAWMLLVQNGLRGLEDPNYGTVAGRIYRNGKAVNGAGSYAEYSYLTGEADGTMSSMRFMRGFMEEWAARADWCVKDYADCNHPPVVEAEAYDITARAGEVVPLCATVTDPDGDELDLSWWVYREASEYEGTLYGLRVHEPDRAATAFTVPVDAQPGDYFNVILEVRDRAEAPMTRYAQVIVTVTE